MLVQTLVFLNTSYSLKYINCHSNGEIYLLSFFRSYWPGKTWQVITYTNDGAIYNGAYTDYRDEN